MKTKEKTTYYEWIRLIACFLVLFNHLKGYFLFLNASGGKQAFYMALSVITKVNVPLFFMVSGALLLGKQEDFVTVVKKRISRICLVILVFSLGIYIECMLYAASQGRAYEFTAKRFLYGLFARNLDETGSYWYLYAYLGFLLLLPLLQKIARQMTRQDFLALLTLRFAVLSFLPVCNLLLQGMGQDSISLAPEFSVALATTAAFFYPLIGYYIDHHMDIASFSGRNVFILLCGGGVTEIAVTCLCVSGNGAVSEEYISLFDYLLAMMVFLFVKYITCTRFPVLSAGKPARTACFLGPLTLGIYLLDPYFKLVLYQGYEAFMEARLPSLLVSFGWCLVSMTLGGAVTWMLKKLPLFRKIL